ncbi:Uncharacterised protein [uncultured archaeon]|nr:Uncharacterised protein [uncultured archaeon]
MNKLLFLIPIIFVIVGYAVLISDNSSSNGLVTAKLVDIQKSADTNGYVQSAGYYEGTLTLVNIQTQKEYSFFACSKDWNWVNESACYTFSPAEVSKNIESHIYSSELSGCFVGELDQVPCS